MPTALRTYTLPDFNTTLLSSGLFGQGDLIFGSGASTTSMLPKDTNATRYLSNTGASNNPAWSLINLVNGVSGILASANGGTGNASTSFTGQTLARVYTLPDANATLLTSNAPVTLAQGGTGGSLATSTGGIVYSSATAFAVLAGTSTAGRVLQSGVNQAPTWSFATYASSSGTFGNYLESDGTNFVSVTPVVNKINRTMFIYSNAGAATASNVGFPAAPTLTATATNADDNTAPFVNQATSATIGNSSGVISAAFNYFRINYSPKFSALIRTDASAITTSGIWLGMFSSNPDNSAAPNIHAAAFRYYSSVDADPFWRAVTIAGTGASATISTTTIPVAIDTAYEMNIDCKSGVDCSFFINGTLVAKHTTNLPESGTTMGYGARITTLASSTRNLKWSKISITHD
jgi:hypothetical protein